jgi:divalent metal cation (Fe/Co/Zn/Cd) transporter
MDLPMAATHGRTVQVRAGIRVEVITIAWMVVEAAAAIGAGVVARSVLLTAFGLDSVIELVSGGVLLWRLLVEASDRALERVERAENRAAWVTGIGLALLCIYVVVLALVALATRTKPESSLVGIGLSIVAALGMPLLARTKRRIAAQIGSAALRGDAACSITCAYMAVTLLVGLLLNALFGWWWADSLAALALVYWLAREAREALESARAGRGGCSCGDDQCGGSSSGRHIPLH